MDHSNIATVFDGRATGNGRPSFVMDLARGVPITTCDDTNKLTPRTGIDLFRKIAPAGSPPLIVPRSGRIPHPVNGEDRPDAPSFSNPPRP